MKTFFYTYSEHTPRNGHTQKTVKIYRVSRNTPVFAVSHTESFVSEFQLVLIAMEKAKLLPKKAFSRHQFGGYKHCAAYLLREAGFASIHRI